MLSTRLRPDIFIFDSSQHGVVLVSCLVDLLYPLVDFYPLGTAFLLQLLDEEEFAF